MADSNTMPSEGDEISHEEFFALAGGTIPFNLTTDHPETGESVIRCHLCGSHAPEEQFEWVNSNVYVESVSDDGVVINHDIQAIHLECPNCEEVFAAR